MTYFIAAVKARGMKLKDLAESLGLSGEALSKRIHGRTPLDAAGGAAGLQSAGHEPGHIFGFFPAGGITNA